MFEGSQTKWEIPDTEFNNGFGKTEDLCGPKKTLGPSSPVQNHLIHCVCLAFSLQKLFAKTDACFAKVAQPVDCSRLQKQVKMCYIFNQARELQSGPWGWHSVALPKSKSSRRWHICTSWSEHCTFCTSAVEATVFLYCAIFRIFTGWQWPLLELPYTGFWQSDCVHLSPALHLVT